MAYEWIYPLLIRKGSLFNDKGLVATRDSLQERVMVLTCYNILFLSFGWVLGFWVFWFLGSTVFHGFLVSGSPGFLGF